jgi:hypothetical protein
MFHNIQPRASGELEFNSPGEGSWAYTQTLDLAGKGLPGTNTLAYYKNK